MKPDRFEVMLVNSQSGVYFAGQTISAVVNLQLSESVKMRGLVLKFKGKSEVRWSEGSGDNRRHYHAKEKYFSHKINLTQYDPDGDAVMQPGTYSYPVNFVLPTNLPSSYEGRHGYVRYVVNVKIDRAWKFDCDVNYPFTLVCLYDLNMDSQARLPAQMQESKMICCLCCATGPVTGVFRIERQGYVPGESIVLNAEIENKSNRPINSSTVRLKMMTLFRAGHKTRTSSDTVCKVERGPIEPFGRDAWRGERLAIPPVPPSHLTFCNIIEIHYILELEADVDNTPFDLTVPLNVVIGNIPLQMAQTGFTQPPPIAMPNDVVMTQPSSVAPSAPPPSYGDSVFGHVDVAGKGEDSQNVKFTPQYTYFTYS